MAQKPDPCAEQIAAVLTETGRTLAVAESLTGGELSAHFAAVGGASDWFRGGLVSYSSAVKRSLLGVPDGPVVSEAAVRAMADGVVALLTADVGVAVTGAAGPSGQDGRPAGTVWIATHVGDQTAARRACLDGSPDDIVDQTIREATSFLHSMLIGERATTGDGG